MTLFIIAILIQTGCLVSTAKYTGDLKDRTDAHIFLRVVGYILWGALLVYLFRIGIGEFN